MKQIDTDIKLNFNSKVILKFKNKKKEDITTKERRCK